MSLSRRFGSSSAENIFGGAIGTSRPTFLRAAELDKVDRQSFTTKCDAVAGFRLRRPGDIAPYLRARGVSYFSRVDVARAEGLEGLEVSMSCGRDRRNVSQNGFA